MIRYIVFDTETTGLDPFTGDRIIEIGAVELIDKQRSGRVFHQLINPQRALSQEVIKLTGITDEVLVDKPTFKEVAARFMAFLTSSCSGCSQTLLVAHNASFDVKFLNFELKQIGLQGLSEFSIIDTLDLARQKFPGQKATLDMLCERFGISLDERHRHGHNALLDSQILVEVFLKLTKGTVGDALQTQQLDFVGFTQRTTQLQARIFKLSAQEQQQHEQFLASNQIVE